MVLNQKDFAEFVESMVGTNMDFHEALVEFILEAFPDIWDNFYNTLEQCYYCGEWHYINDLNTTDTGENVCECCFAENYYEEEN